MTLMIIQLLIVLLALYVGSRYGSLALGAISGIGLAILVLGFGMQPGKPPTDVIYIIIAAVTCAGIMQASGGMDWLIQIAERLLRKHPNHITILAPLCTFFLTVLVGTRHLLEKGNPPGTPLRCSFCRLTGGHYLFPHCSRRRLVRDYLERKRF